MEHGNPTRRPNDNLHRARGIHPNEGGVSMSTLFNRNIQDIVLHHMGDGKPPEISILQRWNPANYDYPEYDFGVEADGTIRNGRPLNFQGAHTLSDKPPYSQKGNQWWNQNSIGIGIAGDFTLYPMPQAQFNALVALVKRLMSQYGLTLDNVYPHGQVTYTDCPGCTYSKLPNAKGLWSYDEFEKAVLSPISSIQPVVANNATTDKDGYVLVRILDSLADEFVKETMKKYACKRIVLP